MPKFIDYPRASFDKALSLANAVAQQGGSNVTYENTAHQMGLKVSGGFTAVIGAAGKHGLVEAKKNELTITKLFESLKLALSVNDRLKLMQYSFLLPPLYKSIYQDYKTKVLPINKLEELLIKDYNVDQKLALRVSGYFLEGAKMCELLFNDVIIDIDEVIENEHFLIEMKSNDKPIQSTVLQQRLFIEEANKEEKKDSSIVDNYEIKISGPGLETRLIITEREDVQIVEAIMNKLNKKF